MMRFLILISFIVITGCATTQFATDSDYSDLYSGRSQLAFVTEMPAGSATTALSAGDQAYRGGELDKALYHYVQSVELDDSAPDAFHRIGLVHRQRGNLPLAARAFRHALERDDSHQAALEELGLIMLHNQELEAAGSFFDRVLAIDPNRVRSHNGLGVIADLNGDHQQAADRFRKALQLQPEATHIMNNLAYSLYLAPDWDEAEKLYDRVLSIDPEHELAARNLALLYVRLGQRQRAIRLLEKFGSSAAANNDVGYLCMLDGQHELAARFFQTAIELSPVYYEKAHNNLAKNRALTKKAPNPRLARLFSPGSVSDKAESNPGTAIDRYAGQSARLSPSPELTPEIFNAKESIAPGEQPSTDYPVAEARPPESDTKYLKRYVRADSLNVRDDSSESGSVMDKILRGRVVRVLRESGGWAYVLYWRHGSGSVISRKGWVHASFLSESDDQGLS